MITCPNCAHLNPDGAVNCEACFTQLPVIKSILCPICNSTVLSDAKFCGHCGANLSTENLINSSQVSIPETTESSTEVFPVLPISSAMSNPIPDETTEGKDVANVISEIPNLPQVDDIEKIIAVEPNISPAIETAPVALGSLTNNAKTQLQQFVASLLHVQTNLIIEIPASLPVVHIGKPNTIIPPDIDVSGFPDSDIVSRIHADIRLDGGNFYFEDTGSSNGTYINNLPLPAGNRHKLRAGDRISLGKGDKVSFIFQLNA
ncbi:FHA domain-containing protein [Pseudanabaena sp. FACHB-1998]|uniref:FHA domain-containing protein n=1 Tax=Pseudanabaena sp. FACHB-1998 TaxID=2692858 RepID=UPI00168118E3|nr:FHA domain-containing protein [Pseudanabaena sp. FACHB-1998]MBD2176064.1 FHA domain-containing protein [Pseudanabaena sp. FACHB-1998]